MDEKQVWREAFAEALIQNLRGDELSPAEAEQAVGYAREFADGEVEAARALAAEGRDAPTVHPCGLCSALTRADPISELAHARWHAQLSTALRLRDPHGTPPPPREVAPGHGSGQQDTTPHHQEDHR